MWPSTVVQSGIKPIRLFILELLFPRGEADRVWSPCGRCEFTTIGHGTGYP